MRASLFTLTSALVALVAASSAYAGERTVYPQSSIKSAQSTNCMMECRDKGWGEDQCKTHCKWKEG